VIDEDSERAALVVVHGHAPGERFDLEAGTVTLGPSDDAVLTCDADGVTLRARSPAAAIHVDFRRVSEARLEHGALVGIGGTLLKFLRCRDLEGAHFDELYRLHRFDGLTDVHHERYLRRRLWSALSHARRHASPLALVVLDLAPRTARGAAITGPAHDLVLREVARAARRATGDDEILGRHGPEPARARAARPRPRGRDPAGRGAARRRRPRRSRSTASASRPDRRSASPPSTAACSPTMHC
jgi:GGDEF domain-containing protein